MSLVFSGAIPVKASRNGRLIHVEGLEYAKFKLFALSVLWRAGVSALPLFAQVKLGAHEEVLRLMVLNNDPGPPEKYPFILAPVLHEGELQSDMIIQPSWARLAGYYSYRFVFGGLAWVFVVSKHRPPPAIVSAAISRTGEITMLETEVANMPFVVNLARKLSENGKL
ncbi:MAG: hypothetical protein Q8L39_03765 [Burkholderiales bacterium]|nr:hypothetical protein [Burkholderiales bacterium]